MTKQFPRNNLDPGSQPWSREVEQRLQALELASGITANRNANNNAGNIAALGQLSSQLQDLMEQQNTLSTQQATLTSQQATLTSQQTTILDLVNTQVAFARNGSGTSNFAIGTSTSVVHSHTITVPNGYTRAIVLGMCNVSVTANVTLEFFYVKVGINEVVSTFSTRNSVGTTNKTTDVAGSAATRTFTGLTAGQTLTTNICMSASANLAANANTTATLDTIAIFLK